MVKPIKPKNINADTVDWRISERGRAIINYYAEYTECTESYIVDKLILEILEDDKEFIKWVNDKRNNLRMINQLGIEDKIKELKENEGKEVG